MRHGNKIGSNKFTGWRDVNLSQQGELEAAFAGKVLKQKGFKFDLAYSSVLKRAIQTYNIVSYELDRPWVNYVKSWRLNERHYGAL